MHCFSNHDPSGMISSYRNRALAQRPPKTTFCVPNGQEAEQWVSILVSRHLSTAKPCEAAESLTVLQATRFQDAGCLIRLRALQTCRWRNTLQTLSSSEKIPQSPDVPEHRQLPLKPNGETKHDGGLKFTRRKAEAYRPQVCAIAGCRITARGGCSRHTSYDF